MLLFQPVCAPATLSLSNDCVATSPAALRRYRAPAKRTLCKVPLVLQNPCFSPVTLPPVSIAFQPGEVGVALACEARAEIAKALPTAIAHHSKPSNSHDFCKFIAWYVILLWAGIFSSCAALISPYGLCNACAPHWCRRQSDADRINGGISRRHG